METADTLLIQQFKQWRDLRIELETLASSTPADDSQLMEDNRALATETTSLALARYVLERAHNTVRTLKKLDHLVFHFDPGEIHLDQTTMYPLM